MLGVRGFASLLTLLVLTPVFLVAEDISTIFFAGWDYNSAKKSWNIYSIPASGGTARAITSGPYDEIFPFIFPNEKAIGYLVEKGYFDPREIYKYDLASGTIASLGITIKANTSCQVSPDGKQLACADAIRKYNQIVVFDLATKERKQITNMKNDCLDPSWSPDGRNLVYWTGKEADKVGDSAKPEGNHLVIYSFENGTHRLLTKQPKGYDAYPRWSPDGNWIAFYKKGASHAEWNISVIRPDGTDETQITAGKGEKSHPAWSPDSKFVAFQCYKPSPDAFDICTVNIQTKEVTSVTLTRKMDEQTPAYMP